MNLTSSFIQKVNKFSSSNENLPTTNLDNLILDAIDEEPLPGYSTDSESQLTKDEKKKKPKPVKLQLTSTFLDNVRHF